MSETTCWGDWHIFGRDDTIHEVEKFLAIGGLYIQERSECYLRVSVHGDMYWGRGIRDQIRDVFPDCLVVGVARIDYLIGVSAYHPASKMDLDLGDDMGSCGNSLERMRGLAEEQEEQAAQGAIPSGSGDL